MIICFNKEREYIMALTVSKNIFLKKYSKALSEGAAALFAGAGLSVDSGYVDWKNLLKPFAEELGLDIEQEHNLASLAQFYKNEKGGARGSINQELIDHYSGNYRLNENIKIATRLPISTYWTTNYDELIERGLEHNNRRADIKSEDEQLVFQIPDADAIVYKMHGDIRSPNKAVLTKEDYEVYNNIRPLFTTVLQGDLVSKTFLFVGFSFEDPNLDYILARTRNILGESIGESYWIEKTISKPDLTSLENAEYKDELQRQYTIDITKQKLKVKELQRYGINTVLVESYNEITEIFKELEERYLRNHVFLSGSIGYYDDHWTETKVNDFCYSLSKRLVEKDFKVYSGFGLGIGSSVINGALDEIYKTKYRQIDEHLILRPFPQYFSNNEERVQQWTMYRESIIKDTGIVIFMFGNKIEKGGKKLANGLREEFEIAKRMNKVIIPIGSTGGMSKEIFEEIENDIVHYPYLKDYVEKLKNETDNEKLISVVIKIMQNL